MNTFSFKNNIFFVLLAILAFGVSMHSCVDQDFDEPPSGGVESPAPNTTIAELRDMHSLGNYEQITEATVIRGFVISSDREGNFFRQLVIQDETGGLEMRIEMTDLDNLFPPGRQVSVNCQGLWLGDFNGLIQLGAAVTGEGNDRELERIPEPLVEDIFVSGTYGNDVSPKLKLISELNFDDVSTLIQLNEVQFANNELGQNYSQSDFSTNRTLTDCNLNDIIVRTSSFSSFAGEKLPEGNGTLIGILGIFGSDLQLLLRDLNDVNMEGDRCGAGGNTVTISSLRSQFEGGNAMITDGAIEGVVISDFETGNVTGRNLYLQDETGGIVVRFGSNHSYDLGTKLRVVVGGLQLSEFNGLLQIEAPDGNGIPLGSGTLPDARTTTVSDLLANIEAWESTLIKIEKATLSGNTIFDGSITVDDGTGQVLMFTRNQASFSGSPVPEGEVTVTGILSQFNDPQIIIRKASDVQGGTTGGGDLNESFDAIGNNDEVVLNGWVNIAVKGTRTWQGKEFDGNHYAQATAFNDSEQEMETWLVTPEIDVTMTPTLTFETAQAFHVHDGLSVWLSENFDGSDIGAATWVEVEDADLANFSSVEHAFIPSGNIDLSSFSAGKVRIGFKYVGSGPGAQTTSFRVDNIVAK
jgi:DNA/RNA endonuclease YhcR with UshA esterase domain